MDNEDTGILIVQAEACISSLTAVTTVGMQNSAVRSDINDTGFPQAPTYQQVLDHVNVVCYFLICALGLTGNGLVIYVVLVFAKMKTVTNMYILNLALSDVMFLTMLPITATTVILKHWIFGLVMCKIYFVLCAINIFGGAFNLCVMTADRYLAICHPVQSLKYRTPRIAMYLSLCVWFMTFLVMLPVILYTTIVKHHKLEDKYSCIIYWPANWLEIIPPGTTFIWYSFILGFVIPVLFISVLYVLVIVRLRRVGAAKKPKANRRSHGRVTRLIFTVVTVYVVCWLPYWSFQVHATFNTFTTPDSSRVLLLNCFTVLSITNSMLNPLLYAFLSENFRQSFMKAFACCSSTDVSLSACNGKIVLPCTSQTHLRLGASAAVEENIELSAMDRSSAAVTGSTGGPNLFKGP